MPSGLPIRINNRFEDSAINNDFLTARHLFGIRKRPASKSLPSVGYLPVGAHIGSRAGEYREVGAQDYPKVLTLQRFDLPGRLRGVDEGSDGYGYIAANSIDLRPFFE